MTYKAELRYGLCPPVRIEDNCKTLLEMSVASLHKKIILEMIANDAPFALIEQDGNFTEVKNPLHELEELRRERSREKLLRINIRNIARENRNLRKKLANLYESYQDLQHEFANLNEEN